MYERHCVESFSSTPSILLLILSHDNPYRYVHQTLTQGPMQRSSHFPAYNCRTLFHVSLYQFTAFQALPSCDRSNRSVYSVLPVYFIWYYGRIISGQVSPCCLPSKIRSLSTNSAQDARIPLVRCQSAWMVGDTLLRCHIHAEIYIRVRSSYKYLLEIVSYQCIY